MQFSRMGVYVAKHPLPIRHRGLHTNITLTERREEKNNSTTINNQWTARQQYCLSVAHAVRMHMRQKVMAPPTHLTKFKPVL